MILALKNGQLIPPASPAAGHKRMLTLVAECSRIEFQLRDPGRKRAYADGKIPGYYDRWRRSAEQALRMHNLERKLLGEWLMKKMAKMLGQAFDIIDSFEVEDLDEEERQFVKQLSEFAAV